MLDAILAISLSIPFVLLIGGSVYYKFFEGRYDPDYRHISHMEHDLGFTPCSLLSCPTCYPQAVTEAPRGLHQTLKSAANIANNHTVPAPSLTADIVRQTYDKQVGYALYGETSAWRYNPRNRCMERVVNGKLERVSDTLFREMGEGVINQQLLRNIRRTSGGGPC